MADVDLLHLLADFFGFDAVAMVVTAMVNHECGHLGRQIGRDWTSKIRPEKNEVIYWWPWVEPVEMF